MRSVTKYFQSMQFKTEGLGILAAVNVISGAILWRLIFNGPLPEIHLYILLSTSALLLTIGSINVIRYKEIPRGGLPSITGFSAVFWGSLSLIISLSAMIVFLYEIFVVL